MRATWLERLLWSVAAVAAGIAVVGARSANRLASSIPVPTLAAAPEPRRYDTDSLANAASSVIQNDPFRLSRQPARVAYAFSSEGQPAPAPVRAPRPNLILRGIVGGPPWSAIIEGIPGRDAGALLRAGDSIATLVIKAVGRDTVIIKGADTTWRLTVRRTW
ncbi:MAG TPA: hypothetical protein VJO33_01930 [Gemmatimonadaceae bacterium]|nr:hypothetical protein [Gemmatimonadaceae bacterium]